MSSFVDQLSRWVRRALGSELKRNINRLVDRSFRSRLLDLARGPVQGTRGEAGQTTPVVPEPPVEVPFEGLYGQPYPGNPHPDPGALWVESAGSWTSLIYPDWQEDFPHPPGVLAGNVFFEHGTDGHVISWHWYPAGGPPGNAVKYMQVPDDFNAWAREEQQAAAPGGDLSRDILHMGKRLYRMPDHWACIGVCAADGWLFMVGFNWSGRGRNWIWSGYDIDDQVLCDPSTDTLLYVAEYAAATPDTIFPPGAQIRIGTEERTVQATTGPLAPNNCWEIQLTAPLSAAPIGGTPIEVIKPGGAFGTYSTRVFAVATTTNVDGDLEVVPGSTLYEIADLIETAWTQQFVAHPDGKHMMGLLYKALVDVNRDIHRLAFDTGSTPPTVQHTIETRLEKGDEVYLNAINDARVIHDCTLTDTNTRVRDTVESGQPCFSCGQGTYYFMYDWVFSGAKVYGFTRDIEDRMGREIDTAYKSRTFAVDYDTNGNELIATLDIDYQSTITVRTQNNWSKTETLNGTISLSPYCSGLAEQWNNVGQYTDVIHESSTLNMEYHLVTDFSIYISVNDVKKIELGSIQDDFKWYNDPTTQSGYSTQTLTYEGNAWIELTCPPDIPECNHPDLNQILCVETLSATLVGNVTESDGTIVQGPNCVDLPTYDYESFYAADPVAYDIRNIATPLLFLDLRAGVYVTQGREGIIDDIYELVETQGNSTFSDRQMYPYTVEDANFSPSKPPLQDRGNYDQHWAAWGADFTPEAMIGSPAPIWLTITQFDKKGPTDLTNPVNWKPSDFIKTNDAVTPVQGSAQRSGKQLVNVYVELPTAGQETLQAAVLRNPTGDPLSLIGIPTADKITNIGAV